MLPKLSHPTFEATIPSTGRKVKFRPFVVKEYKTLLKAIEFEDETNLIETFKSLIEECTFGKLDVNKLAMFDVDWLYLKIRGASSGTVNPIKYKCNNTVTVKNEDGDEVDQPCGSEVTVAVDTERATINVPETETIFVTEDIAMKMRWPSFEDYVRKGNMTSLVDVSDDFVLDCIESVSDRERTYVLGDDFSREELRDFIENLTDEVVGKIKRFIAGIPEVELVQEIRCPKCGARETLHFRGLNDFLE